MKKTIIPLILCAALLSGCAGAPAVTAEGNKVTFNEMGTSALFPEGWTVYTGDALYEQIYRSYADSFSSAEEMKELLEESGLEYLAYGLSEDLGSIVTVSVQDMTADTAEEYDSTAEEYARTVHDSTVFSYQASGYRISGSGFSQETYGGNTGYLSRFEAISTDEEQAFVIGMSEFMFEKGTDMYSIQIVYSAAEDKAEALSVLESMSAASAD